MKRVDISGYKDIYDYLKKLYKQKEKTERFNYNYPIIASNMFSFFCYDRFLFTDTPIAIAQGFMDDANIAVDFGTAKWLFEKVYNSLGEEFKIEDLFRAISSAIFEFNGGPYVTGGMKERLALIDEDKDYTNISMFKGKKLAYCVERSSMFHQICKLFGINSYIAFADVCFDNGKIEMHCFNIVLENNKAYIIDCSLIDNRKLINGEYNPVVRVLDNCKTIEDLANFAVFENEYFDTKGVRHKVCYNHYRAKPFSQNLTFGHSVS